MYEHGRIADCIFEDLRDQILKGTLSDGMRLPAEGELARRYGVGGASVHESVRALSTMGLLTIRQGSGTFVTASEESMIAASITSLIRLKDIGATETLSLQGALNAYAAELAASKATASEIDALRAAAERLTVIDDVDRATVDLKRFVCMLSEISHDQLLAALCAFFAEVQVELAYNLSGGPDLADWQNIAGGLHPYRMAIVEALEVRDGPRAAEMVKAFHARAIEVVTAQRCAVELETADPLDSHLVASLLKRKLA